MAYETLSKIQRLEGTRFYFQQRFLCCCFVLFFHLRVQVLVAGKHCFPLRNLPNSRRDESEITEHSTRKADKIQTFRWKGIYLISLSAEWMQLFGFICILRQSNYNNTYYYNDFMFPVQTSSDRLLPKLSVFKRREKK